MASSGAFLLTIVFALCLGYSYQLQCYECTEGTETSPTSLRNLNSPCGNFSDDLLVTCENNGTTCLKVDTDIGNVTTSVHKCATEKETCQTIEDAAADDESVSCYSCDTEKCNGASSFAAATSLLAVSLVIAKLY